MINNFELQNRAILHRQAEIRIGVTRFLFTNNPTAWDILIDKITKILPGYGSYEIFGSQIRFFADDFKLAPVYELSSAISAMIKSMLLDNDIWNICYTTCISRAVNKHDITCAEEARRTNDYSLCDVKLLSDKCLVVSLI